MSASFSIFPVVQGLSSQTINNKGLQRYKLLSRTIAISYFINLPVAGVLKDIGVVVCVYKCVHVCVCV